MKEAYGILDIGTTNTRLAIVDGGGAVISQTRARLGVKDVASGGSVEALRSGVGDLVRNVVDSLDASELQLRALMASGMVTSEVGLAELPHLDAPVSMDDLAAAIVSFPPGKILPFPIAVHLVRGVRAPIPPAPLPIDAAYGLDFMRGEETQIAGLLASGRVSPPFSAVVLSSHTKFVPVDPEGRILGSVTTLSGQLFDVVVHNTLIGKSIPDEAAGLLDAIDDEVIDAAAESLDRGGFLRALMIPRFMDTLMDTTAAQRRGFMETALAVEDMQALKEYPRRGFSSAAPFVLIGNAARCGIYARVLRRFLGKDHPVLAISEREDIESLAIGGALDLGRRAGIVKG